MMSKEIHIEGIVLDEELSVSFAELTHLCGANRRIVRRMVTEGLLRPVGQRPEDWRFSGFEVRRARRAVRLRRDLDLNLAGTALALELLEELEALRQRVRLLEARRGDR